MCLFALKFVHIFIVNAQIAFMLVIYCIKIENLMDWSN